MKRVLIVLTSHATLGDRGQPTGYYLCEVAQPYLVFEEEAGYQVELASTKGGEPSVIENSVNLNDPYNKRFLERADILSALRGTSRLADLRASSYQAIFFAGSHGAMWDFPRDPALIDIASDIYEQGGVVSAVCHGAAALVNIRLEDGRFRVEGQKVTSFTNEEEQDARTAHIVPLSLEDRLIDRGARFTHAGKLQRHVVTSGYLITGQNPASAMGTAEAVVALLKTGNQVISA
jgi:putative intracellular protease/amidase